MFRLRFADGGELVLTEAGKKKRAGVWLVTPEQLETDLSHLGPDALELDAASLAEILGGSAGSSTPCSATSARSPASAAPTRTRSCCGLGSRRSRRRRS